MPSPPRYYVIPRSGGLAYLVNPKAATSTIKVALTHFCRGSVPALGEQAQLSDTHPVHVWDQRVQELFATYLFESLRPPRDFLRFTFVRDPYNRFISFYQSKIRHQQDVGRKYARFGLGADTSLEDAIRTIVTIDPTEFGDDHSLPQSHIIVRDGELMADYVGRVEDIDSGWQTVCRVAGHSVALEHENRSSPKRKPLASELQLLLYNYYRADFELFGYESGLDTAAGEPAQPCSLGGVPVSELRRRIGENNLRVEEMSGRLVADRDARARREEQVREGMHELVFKQAWEQRSAAERIVSDARRFQSSLPSAIRAQLEDEVRVLVEAQDRQTNALLELQNQVERGLALQAEARERQARTDALQRWSLAALRRHDKRAAQDRSDRRVLELFGGIDEAWYRRQYLQAAQRQVDPTTHFLTAGIFAGHSPAPWFDAGTYLAATPAAVSSPMNPFVHYLLHGQRSDFDEVPREVVRTAPPMPAVQVEQARREYDAAYDAGDLDRCRELLLQLGNPDALGPLLHYLIFHGDDSRLSIPIWNAAVADFLTNNRPMRLDDMLRFRALAEYCDYEGVDERDVNRQVLALAADDPADTIRSQLFRIREDGCDILPLVEDWESRIGEDFAPVSVFYEQAAANALSGGDNLLEFRDGEWVSMPLNATSRTVIELYLPFLPTIYRGRKGMFAEVFAVTRRRFQALVVGLQRLDCVVLPRLTTMQPLRRSQAVGDACIAYHTRGTDRPALHFKEGYLPGYFYLDPDGYSGWARCARLSEEELGASDVPADEVERFFDELQTKYVRGRSSKYAQETKPLRIPSGKSMVFVAMQVPNDTVAQLAHVDTIRLAEIVAERFEGTETLVYVKRHPVDKLGYSEERLGRLAQLKNVVVTDASIHDLIAKADCVFTVNSGVGFESLLQLKPVVTTGRCDYGIATVRATSEDELRTILNAPLPRADAEAIKRFLYVFLHRFQWREGDGAFMQRALDDLMRRASDVSVASSVTLAPKTIIHRVAEAGARPTSAKPAGKAVWRKLRKLQRDPVAFFVDAGQNAYEGGWERKLRKLRRDPKQFFEDAGKNLVHQRRWDKKLRKLRNDPEQFFEDAAKNLARGLKKGGRRRR